MPAQFLWVAADGFLEHQKAAAHKRTPIMIDRGALDQYVDRLRRIEWEANKERISFDGCKCYKHIAESAERAALIRDRLSDELMQIKHYRLAYLVEQSKGMQSPLNYALHLATKVETPDNLYNMRDPFEWVHAPFEWVRRDPDDWDWKTGLGLRT